MRRRKRGRVSAVSVTMFVIAGVCAWFAIQSYKPYAEAGLKYHRILSEFTSEVKEGSNGKEFLIDWNGLMAKNSDVVGWIRLDSGANYPIVQTKDNDYYLHRGIDKGYLAAGSIFMDCNNSPKWSDKNTIIYGHNMKNGSMFGLNRKYWDQDYGKNHPYFYVYTPDGCYKYRIFATMTVKDGSEPYTIRFANNKDFGNYLDKMISKRDYSLDAYPLSSGQIVTLSTCTHDGEDRYIIQGYQDGFIPGEGNANIRKQTSKTKK